MIPRNLLPPELNYFIAGGYAACPALAEDMDVWVSVPKGYDTDEVRSDILRHLTEQGFFFDEEDNMPVEVIDDYLMMEFNQVRKVARVEGPQLWTPIHILVTDADVREVLDNFDISTHQIALTVMGPIYGDRWTSITQPPVKLKNTPRTERRMSKIRSRYKMYTQNQELV